MTKNGNWGSSQEPQASTELAAGLFFNCKWFCSTCNKNLFSICLDYFNENIKGRPKM